jgi:hypothetical protein
LVEEELLAREARALGLDQGDTVVRRRLAQKLGFLVDDTSQMVEPGDDELRDFYSANLDRFRTEPRLSFAQVFFSTERRPDAEADARAALMKVAATVKGGNPVDVGDPWLLEENFTDIGRRDLSSRFGADFADAVFALAPGSWHGPIRSSFGLHLVQITHIQASEVRPFEAVRAAVAEEWRRDREMEIKAAYLGKLRAKYGLVIDDRAKALLPAEATGGAVQ